MPKKTALQKAAALLGSVSSEAKTEAARKNAKRPRKRKPVVDPIKRRWLRIE